MPAGYLYRFDGGAGKWKRDYHRADKVYNGAQGGLGTTVIFNNTFAGDFLITAASLMIINGSAGIGNAYMDIAVDGGGSLWTILGVASSPGSGSQISICFPMPLEIIPGRTITIQTQAAMTAEGTIYGAQETP